MSSPDREPTMQEISDAFVDHLRRGGRPTIDEYKTRYPQFADAIDDVFPTLEMLEKCDVAPEDSPTPLAAAADLPPKHLGDYRILQEIGRGGMGIVFEAEHVKMKRRVALKVLPKSSAQVSSNLARFDQEARSAGQLHHSNIVPVFEVGEEDGFHFYAMQFIRGDNLDRVIGEVRAMREAATDELQNAVAGKRNVEDVTARDNTVSQTVAVRMIAGRTCESGVNAAKPIASSVTKSEIKKSSESVFDSSEWSVTGRARGAYFRRVAALGEQVADALAYAHHNGVLHRDIKPANLILDTDGTVWITDFGLAKGGDEALTRTGDIVGTLRYMAPERFRGHSDHRCDIYSLGISLYELATLRNAFESTDRATLVQQVTEQKPIAPRRIDPSIPRDLETIILKAIDRNADRRYRSAKRLSEDLQSFLADRPIRARRTTLTERLWRSCRRNPVTAALSAASLFLLLTVAIGASVSAYRINRQHARAAHHLKLTQHTIDRMLDRVAYELRNVPQMDGVREELLEEALALQQELLQVEQDNSQVALQTVGAHRRMAQILQQMNRYDEATESARRAVELAESISTNAGPSGQLELGRSRSRLASLLRDQAANSEAEETALAAITAFNQVPASMWDSADGLAIAEAHRQLGAVREQTGQLDLSQDSFESALSILDQVMTTDLAADDRLDNLAKRTEILNGLAIVCRRAGKLDESESRFQKCLQLCEQILSDDSERVDVRDQFGVTAQNLGNLMIYKRSYDEAAAAYQQAMETFDQLKQDFPQTISFRQHAARSLLSMAIVDKNRGLFGSAEAAFRRAIRECSEINAEYGDNASSLDIKAVAYTNLGNMLVDQGGLKPGIAVLKQSVEIRQQMVETDDATPRFRNSLAISKSSLAEAMMKNEQLELANAMMLSALADANAMVAEYPKIPSYRKVAKSICASLCELLPRLGKYDELKVQTLQLSNYSPDEPDLQMYVAVCLAAGAEHAQHDGSLPAEEREREFNELAQQAIPFIEQALTLGWESDEQLAEIEQFDSLRELEGFQQLIE